MYVSLKQMYLLYVIYKSDLMSSFKCSKTHSEFIPSILKHISFKYSKNQKQQNVKWLFCILLSFQALTTHLTQRAGTAINALLVCTTTDTVMEQPSASCVCYNMKNTEP